MTVPTGILKARQFLFACEEQAMAALPADFPRPERKLMWTILQLHYGDPAVHFELQPQPSRRQVELGLHFEGPAEANDAWAARMAGRASELIAALGAEWELEVWTASWRRLHRVFAAEQLTGELAGEVAGQLARALVTLQPLILEGGGVVAGAAAAVRTLGGHSSRRWRDRRAGRGAG